MLNNDRPNLASCLKAFNRKERYFLLNTALGRPKLSAEFRQNLSERLGWYIPEDAWWGMDYHIDWLYGAMWTHAAAEKGQELQPTRNDADDPTVAGHQEDLDFIVAHENKAVLLEAKFDGAWGNSQASSKVARLRRLWSSYASLCEQWGITPKAELWFVLASAREPQMLKTYNEPVSLFGREEKLAWIPLEGSESGRFLTVRRCDADGVIKLSDHWSVFVKQGSVEKRLARWSDLSE